MRKPGLFLLVLAGIVALPMATAPPAMARATGRHAGASLASHPSSGPVASSHSGFHPEGENSLTPNRSRGDGDRDRREPFYATVFDPFYFDPYWAPAYWGPGWDRLYWMRGNWYPNMMYGNPAVALPPDEVPVQLHVRPWKAELILDGSDLGRARDFDSSDHPLWLSPGEHRLELRYPGYQVQDLKVTVEKGVPYNLHYRLEKEEGTDSRSS